MGSIFHGKDANYYCFFFVGMCMFFFVFYVEYNKKRLLASVDTVNNLQSDNTNVEKTSTELQPATDIVKLASHFGKVNQTGSQGKIKTKLFSRYL